MVEGPRRVFSLDVHPADRVVMECRTGVLVMHVGVLWRVSLKLFEARLVTKVVRVPFMLHVTDSILR
jgi:hypothetical protein